MDIEAGFDGLRREFKRDALGQVVEVRRPDGRVTKYVYDAAGRVLVAAQPDASSHWFKYRGDGELLEAMNGLVTVRFERNSKGSLGSRRSTVQRVCG